MKISVHPYEYMLAVNVEHYRGKRPAIASAIALRERSFAALKEDVSMLLLARGFPLDAVEFGEELTSRAFVFCSSTPAFVFVSCAPEIAEALKTLSGIDSMDLCE